MHKFIIIIMLTFALYSHSSAQNASFTITADTVDEGKIFNGKITFADLEAEKSFTWLSQGSSYAPDTALLHKLSPLLRYQLVVFMGTWCDDSHDLIPKLQKVLKEIHFPDAQIVMYGVDRLKETQDGAHKKYNITFVPTIIVINGEGNELGRITESVKSSIESDLVSIISGN